MQHGCTKHVTQPDLCKPWMQRQIDVSLPKAFNSSNMPASANALDGLGHRASLLHCLNCCTMPDVHERLQSLHPRSHPAHDTQPNIVQSSDRKCYRGDEDVTRNARSNLRPNCHQIVPKKHWIQGGVGHLDRSISSQGGRSRSSATGNPRKHCRSRQSQTELMRKDPFCRCRNGRRFLGNVGCEHKCPVGGFQHRHSKARLAASPD